MYIRNAQKYLNDIYIQDPIGTDSEGNEITLIDIICADKDSIADQVDLKMQAKNLYARLGHVLKDREKLVIVLRYGLFNTKERTQKQIADMLGISRSYVSRIEKKALKKLSKEIRQ